MTYDGNDTRYFFFPRNEILNELIDWVCFYKVKMAV